MTAGERIRILRNKTGKTMEAFGEMVGVGRAAISNIENGNRELTPQMARAISLAFGVNELWLKEGTGPMYSNTAGTVAAEVAAKLQLDEWGTGILERFCALSPSERKEFLRLAKSVFCDRDAEDVDKGLEQAAAAGARAGAEAYAELMDGKRAEDA